MKKLLFVFAFASLAFFACNNNETPSSEKDAPASVQSEPTINQDSIDKAHGHSHDPAGNHVPAPTVNQDSVDKAHGHKH
ncbi:MAG: hypothetical protein JNK20_01070 [Flavipsychrobacter sp.]|nr:hypothetical protein [Flavipsychrobacter sp.]